MKSIIYIERNNLYYYGGNVHAPIAFPFQPTIVRDIEVINSEELTNQLNEFIKKNKIEPTETAIVLSHQSSFEKTLPPKTDQVVIDAEQKKFLENVPFSKTLSLVFTNEKGTKIIAVNEDLAYLIRDIFTKHEFQVEAISSITPISPDNDLSFSAETAQQILKKASLLKQYGFPLVAAEAIITDKFDDGFVQEKKNTKLYLMIAVFVIAAAVLAFLLWNRQNASKNKSNTRITPAPSARNANPSPTIAPTEILPTPTTVTINKSALTIQILNGSGIAGQAEEISDDLREAGYQSITIGNSPTTQSNNSLIVYKSNVSQTQLKEVTDIVSNIAGKITTQTNENIQFDILITTSRGT